MSTLSLSGPTLLPSGSIEDATVIVRDGAIAEVRSGLDSSADLRTGGVIAPGYIDMQLNGGYGLDFTGDPETILEVSRRLPATGVTTYLPTRITSAIDTYVPWLRRAEQVLREAKGAWPAGIHLEGVYFSHRRYGAHNPDFLRAINVEEINTRYAASDAVRVVTLAPELPGALDAIRSLRARGIIVSAGHTNGTWAEAQAGIEAGINWGTHLFNAMPGPESREPQISTALLLGNVPVGMIVDGVHLHPGIVDLAYRAKGAKGITLVTDSMAAMGQGPGVYKLGIYNVIVDERCARLETGSLAGSIVTMDAEVRHMMAQTGCSLAEALTMASTNAADLLGLPNKGRIRPGADADIVVLDEGQRVLHTIIGGEVWQP